MKKVFVKYFTAILTNDINLLPKAIQKLEKYFGKSDHAGNWTDFKFTDFYEPEMGKNLKRCLVSFTKLMPPSKLPEAKKITAKVENLFRDKNKKRKVNIDAGYLDFCKVVLASGKIGGHKISLTKECYADMILDYRKGIWTSFPWTFPDFESGIYNESLTKIRELFREDAAKNQA